MLLTTEEQDCLIDTYIKRFKARNEYLSTEDYIELILYRLITEMENKHADKIKKIRNMLDNQ